jgi:hypothetical protein
MISLDTKTVKIKNFLKRHHLGNKRHALDFKKTLVNIYDKIPVPIICKQFYQLVMKIGTNVPIKNELKT